MRKQRPTLSSSDPLSKFEPRWVTVSVIVWIAILVVASVAFFYLPDRKTVDWRYPFLYAWILVFIVGGVCATIVSAIRRHRLARSEMRFYQSKCISCGYDLRASGEQCPECGTVQVLNGIKRGPSLISEELRASETEHPSADSAA